MSVIAKTKCVILIADGKPDRAGDMLNIEKIKLPKFDVPVYLDTFGRPDRVVGFAELKKEKNEVWADISFFRNVWDLPLFPCASGKILERNPNNHFSIEGAVIESVSLSTIGNADERIKPIKVSK